VTRLGTAHTSQRETTPGRGTGAGLYAFGGIWIAAFLFLAVLVDVRVFYEAGAWFPCFSLDGRSCLPMLRTPGGPVEFADALLAQLDTYGWPSAAVLAMVVAGLAMSVRYLAAQALGGPHLAWACLVAGLALMTFGRYGRHGAALLGLALAVGLAGLHAAWHTGSRATRLTRFLVLGVLAYWLTGGPVVVFALFCAAVEFGARRDEPLGAAILLTGCAIPLPFGIGLAGLPLGAAFGRLLPMYAPAQYEGLLALYMLYATVILLCAAAVLRGRGRVARRPEGQPARRRGLLAWAVRHPRATAVLVPAVALVAVVGTVDWRRGLELQLCRAARRGEWKRVLALAPRLGRAPPAPEVVYCINQALLHSGALLDSMFGYPQFPLGLTMGMAIDARTLPAVHELRRRLFFDLGDATLELGLANEAEHEAFEVLTEAGPHPTILLRLARVYTVKGNTPALKHVLHALANDVVHAAQARAWLDRLRAEPSSGETPEVLAIRRHRLVDDAYDVGLDVPRRCELLLAADPQNRAAADCLLGQYLLERDPAAVVKNLGRLRAAGYTSLPRHIQEAVVLQEGLQPGPVDYQGWPVDPDVRATYQRFAAALQPLRGTGDAEAAIRTLAAQFGTSYFLYYVSGRPQGPPK